MTSVLPEEDKAARLKQKLMSDAHKEESRSFLSFSRENLSISHSDLEHGFNRKYKPTRNTVLSISALLLGILCLGLETWKLHCSLTNAKQIEELRRDMETLKHRFLEEDLLDELKAFEEQLYAEGSTDDDPGEASIDNVDYESIYEDDYSEDYHTPPTYASRASDLPDSTAQPVPSPPEPTPNKALMEILAAFRKVEAKRGQEHKPEKEKEDVNVTRHKREVDWEKVREELRGKREIKSEPGETAPRRNRTRKMYVSRLRMRESFGERQEERPQNTSINVWDRHPPKKYYAHGRPDVVHDTPSTHQHESASQIVRSSKFLHDEADDDGEFTSEDNSTSVDLVDREDPSHREGKSRPRRRRKHLHAPRRVIALHYAADSALIHQEEAVHYGNGRVRHYDGVFKAWRPSDWVTNLGMDRYFIMTRDGRLTVNEPGLYLAYAQIHYLDNHDENGFRLYVNGRSILQCMVYSPGHDHKSRSCFSAQVTFLNVGDVVYLKDVVSERDTLLQHDKSFFGLVKLGEHRPLQRPTTESISTDDH